MKFLIFFVFIIFSVKTLAGENHYHYIGESNYFIASDGKRCLIDFGQPLEIGAPGPQDGLVMFEIIQTEGECSGERIPVSIELVKKGVLEEYHYKGGSDYFTAISGKECLIDPGQPLIVRGPGPQDGLVMYKIIHAEECSGEMITLPEELVGKGILSVGGLSINDLEALTDSQLNDRPRDKNYDRFRGHAYYIGEEISVKLTDEDARSCIILPGTEVDIILSFSEDLQFVTALVMDNTMSVELEDESFCGNDEFVYVPPQFLSKETPHSSIYIDVIERKNRMEACPVIEMFKNTLLCNEANAQINQLGHLPGDVLNATQMTEICDTLSYQNNFPQNNPVVQSFISQIILCAGDFKCNKQKAQSAKAELCSGK